MNLLLDTHAWLWFHLGDPQLSQAAKQHILDPAHAKFVSPASMWEIAIKISLGKYALGVPYGPIHQRVNFRPRISTARHRARAHRVGRHASLSDDRRQATPRSV